MNSNEKDDCRKQRLMEFRGIDCRTRITVFFLKMSSPENCSRILNSSTRGLLSARSLELRQNDTHAGGAERQGQNTIVPRSRLHQSHLHDMVQSGRAKRTGWHKVEDSIMAQETTKAIPMVPKNLYLHRTTNRPPNPFRAEVPFRDDGGAESLHQVREGVFLGRSGTRWKFGGAMGSNGGQQPGMPI